MRKCQILIGQGPSEGVREQEEDLDHATELSGKIIGSGPEDGSEPEGDTVEAFDPEGEG